MLPAAIMAKDKYFFATIHGSYALRVQTEPKKRLSFIGFEREPSALSQ